MRRSSIGESISGISKMGTGEMKEGCHVEELPDTCLQRFSVGALPSIYYIPDFVTTKEQDRLLHQVNAAPLAKWKVLKNRRLQNWGGVVHEKGLLSQLCRYHLPVPCFSFLGSYCGWTLIFQPGKSSCMNWVERESKAEPLFIGHECRMVTKLKVVVEVRFNLLILGRFHFALDGCSATMVDSYNGEDSPMHKAVSITDQHVLVNEYLPGQGIMPHQDGPLYYPVVVILSLGSPALMHFTPHARILGSHEEDVLDLSTVRGADEQGQQLTRCTEGEHQRLARFSVALMPGSLLIFKDSAYEDYLHGIDESFEHVLDDTVINLEACPSQAEHMEACNVLHDGLAERSMEWKNVDNMQEKETSLEGATPVRGNIRRTGTRISLTCRLVSRVQKNFLRL